MSPVNSHSKPSMYAGPRLRSQPDMALMQGAFYDNMQDRIVAGILPQLPLIARTTGPHLGSIIETLATMGGSPESPLEQLNKQEFQVLNQLEQKYMNTLSEYARLHKEYTSNVGNTIGGGGATAAMQANLPLHQQIVALNEQLLSQSANIWTEVQKIHAADAGAETVVGGTRAALQKQLLQLAQEKRILEQLEQEQHTLAAEVRGAEQLANTSYYRYIVWGVAATTLASVAFHQWVKG